MALLDTKTESIPDNKAANAFLGLLSVSAQRSVAFCFFRMVSPGSVELTRTFTVRLLRSGSVQ